MSRAWRWLRYHGVSIWAALAIAYLLIPIALIAVFSFNDPEGKFNYIWNGFTTEHWTNIFGVEELTDAFLTSLRLAALSTLLSTILGTLIALALVRHQFRGRKVANFLIVIPMATPEIIMGASLLSFFLILNIFSLGFQTLLALLIVVWSLLLVKAETALGAVLAVGIIALAGTMFWFLVKALARIQMPDSRPPPP